MLKYHKKLRKKRRKQKTRFCLLLNCKLTRDHRPNRRFCRQNNFSYHYFSYIDLCFWPAFKSEGILNQALHILIRMLWLFFLRNYISNIMNSSPSNYKQEQRNTERNAAEKLNFANLNCLSSLNESVIHTANWYHALSIMRIWIFTSVIGFSRNWKCMFSQIWKDFEALILQWDLLWILLQCRRPGTELIGNALLQCFPMCGSRSPGCKVSVGGSRGSHLLRNCENTSNVKGIYLWTFDC